MGPGLGHDTDCVCVWGGWEGHRFQLSVSHNSWLCDVKSSIKGLIIATVMLSNDYFRVNVCVCVLQEKKRGKTGQVEEKMTKLRKNQVHKDQTQWRHGDQRWSTLCGEGMILGGT